MSQHRYFNFQDDDSTDSLNRRQLGAIPPGLYRGFDYNPASSGVNLLLYHDITGYKDVDLTNTESGYKGLVITRQGVAIVEDAALASIALSSNSANANPRIDLIVLEHEYVSTPGGIVATYSQIVGTPASNPTAPALTFPTKQIVIGTIYWTANAGSLTTTGVTYTKAAAPTFANDADLMRLTGTQVVTGTKLINKVSSKSLPLTYDAVNYKLAPVNKEYSNNYHLDFIDTSYKTVGVLDIATIANHVEQVEIYTAQKLRITSDPSLSIAGNNVILENEATDMYAEPGEAISFIKLNANTLTGVTTDKWFVVKGSTAGRSNINKYFAQQVANQGVASINAATGIITLDKKGNYYELAVDYATLTVGIKGMTSFADRWDGVNNTTKGGAMVVVALRDTNGTPGVNKVTLQYNETVATGFAPFLTDVAADQSISTNCVLLCVETPTGWRIVAATDKDINLWQLWSEFVALSQTREHTYTKTQSTGYKDLGGGSGVFDSVTGTLFITDEGNSFKVGVPPFDTGGLLKDIKYIRNGAPTTCPTGMIVNIGFYHNVWVPGVSETFRLDGNSGSNFSLSLTTEMMSPGAGNYLWILSNWLVDTHIITFRKTATKWEIVSHNYDAYIFNRITPSAWTTISSLGANWTVAGGGAGTPRYRRDGSGKVTLSGVIRINASGAASVAFSMPSGFRPTQAERFVAMTSKSDNHVAYVEVAVNGNVTVTLDGGLSAWVGYEISLANISYYNS